MNDGRHIDQYDASTTEAVLGELADVIRASGFLASHLVVIGGLVPTLLVPAPEPGGQEHIGTTDLDLCLSVALIEGDTEAYERLETAITGIGFEQGDASFRWIRRAGLRMTLEFFCPSSDERPAGRAYRPAAVTNATAKHNLGGRLSALSLDAGRILVADVENVERTVRLPDERGELRVTFCVTGPLAFLVAKSEALKLRDKPKDAYDIVWIVENWPGGPAGAAAAVLEREAYDDTTREQLSQMERLFADERQVGPASYASFVAAPPDELLSRRRAVGAIREFFSAIDE